MGDPDLVGHVHRLVVFDLDGTLVDSRQDLADSANALIVARGGRPLADAAIAAMVGEGAAVLVRRALETANLAVDERALPQFLELYDERLTRHTRPYPGIVPALEDLSGDPGIATAVLTNKPTAHTEALIRALALDRFVDTIIGGDGAFPRKPDPASIQHLMATHGATAADTVLVGDSEIDIQTSRNAGIHMCLARYGFGSARVRASDLRGDEGLVDDPADIPAVVRRMLESGARS